MRIRPGGQLKPGRIQTAGIWVPGKRGRAVPGGGGGGFSPKSIPGLLGWYKADSLALADGASVTSWPDQSGNGYDLVPGTAPTFHTNVVNGLPTVRFDAALSQWLTTTIPNTPQPLTVVAVLVPPFGGSRWFGAGGAGIRIGSAADLMVWAGGSTLDTFTNVTVPSVASIVVDGASSKIRLNGTLLITGNPGSNAPGTSYGPGSEGDGFQNWTGDMPELIVYAAAVADADLAQLESYCSTKYAL